MSNKSSHTPGPYSVLEAVTGFQITAKAQTEQYQGQAVAIAEVRSWDGEPPINQVRANADLFAAAPDLLTAARTAFDLIQELRTYVLQEVDYDLCVTSIVNELAEAIEKAEGE